MDKQRITEQYLELSLGLDSIDTYFTRKAILSAIKLNLPSFKNDILDIGAGHAPYRDLFLNSSTVNNYWSIDIPNEIYNPPDVLWNGKKLPFPKNSISCVLLTEVLEHIPQPSDLVREIYRVLLPKGKLFITVPFLWPLHDIPNDYFRYTPWSLQNLLTSCGFHEIHIEALGGWNASLAQMIGLWVIRHYNKRYDLRDYKASDLMKIKYEIKQRVWKKLIQLLALEIIKKLIQDDISPTSFSRSTMVTGFLCKAIK